MRFIFDNSSNTGGAAFPLGTTSALPDAFHAVHRLTPEACAAGTMTANSSTALPLLAEMLPAAGVSNESSQYIGLSRWDIPAQTLALPGIQGGWFALPDPGASAAFATRYTAAYGERPLDIAGLAFDGIAAIGSLVKSGNRNALSASSLTQGAGFKGANGIFRLRADGTNQRGLAVATVRGNQVVLLEAAPQAFGGAGF